MGVELPILGIVLGPDGVPIRIIRSPSREPSREPSPEPPGAPGEGEPILVGERIAVGGGQIDFFVLGEAIRVPCPYKNGAEKTLYPACVTFKDGKTMDLVVCGCFQGNLLYPDSKGSPAELPVELPGGGRRYNGPFQGRLLGVQIGSSFTNFNFVRIYYRCPYPGQPCDLFHWFKDADPRVVQALKPLFLNGGYCATLDGDYSSSLRQLIVERDLQGAPFARRSSLADGRLAQRRSG